MSVAHAYPSELKNQRVCRVFFSSPFNGMEGEREEFTKKYWPRLQSLCNSKGIQFIPVDMRWGITSEQADSAQTVNICLREIDRSDVFVGFFGQRYGWYGEQDESLQKNFDNATSSYPWLSDVRDRSVTELEFLHGHLNNPGMLPACICFRDKAYDDKMREVGVKDGNKKQIYKYSPESDHATQMMDDLKNRVKDTENMCLAVNMAFKTPEEGARFMFDAVWSYLTSTLLAAPGVKADLEIGSEETSLHDAFRNSRCDLHIGAQKYMEQIDQHLEKRTGKPLLVMGESGCGKSALLSNWILQKQESQTNLIMFYHFLGCASGSTGISNILGRMALALAKANHSSEQQMKNIHNMVDVKELVQTCHQQMHQLQKNKRSAVIMIDALNKIDKDKARTRKNLFWLPQDLPENIHLIVSTDKDDQETVTELRDNRQYEVLSMEGLDPASITELCIETLKQRGKTLSEDQQKTVVEAPCASNALYLKVVLEELSSFGYFRLLDEKMKTLVKSSSVKELFDEYLKRLEKDYNVEENLVEKVMTALYSSKSGVSETDLMSMFDIASHIWSPLYFAMEKYVILRSGFIVFGHQQLEAAVFDRYIQSEEKRKKCVTELKDYYFKKIEGKHDIYKTMKNDQHCVMEVIRLSADVNDVKTLFKMITTIPVFEYLLSNHQYDLLEYFNKYEAPPSNILEWYLNSMNKLTAEYYVKDLDDYNEELTSATEFVLKTLHNLSIFMNVGGWLEEKEQIYHHNKKVLEEAKYVKNREEQLADIIYKLACISIDIGKYDQGEKLHLEALEYYQKQYGGLGHSTKNLGSSHHGLGTLYLHQKDYERAEKFLWKSIELHRQGTEEDKYDLVLNESQSLNNLGLLYMGQQKIERAIEVFNESIKKLEDHYFGELPHDMAYTIHNLSLCYKRIQKFDESAELLDRSQKMKINALGENHPDVAVGWMNFGGLELMQEHYEKAGEYYRKGISVYEKCHSYDVRNYLKMKESYVLVLINQKKFAEGETLYWDVFDSLVERGELDFGLPYVHRNYMNYFINVTHENDKATKITEKAVCTSWAEGQEFSILHYLDSLKPTAERPARAHEQSLDYALKIFPNHLGVVMAKICYELAVKGQSKEIISLLENFFEKNPNPNASLQKIVIDSGNYLSENGHTEAEGEVLLYGLQKLPDCQDFMINLAVNYAKKKMYPEAAIYAGKLAESATSPLWPLKTAQFSLLTGDVETAEKWVKVLEEKWKEDEAVMQQVHILKGSILEVKKHFEGQQ